VCSDSVVFLVFTFIGRFLPLMNFTGSGSVVSTLFNFTFTTRVVPIVEYYLHAHNFKYDMFTIEDPCYDH
jgi:hypothetical protein